MLQSNLLDISGGGLKSQKEKQLDRDCPWPDTYTQVESIPRYWLGALLQRLNTKFDDSRLEAITRADGNGVRKLIQFACGLEDSSSLPPSCHSKYVCTEWFLHVYKQHGSRLDGGWPDDFVEVDGSIDWTGGGSYRLSAGPGGVYIQHVEITSKVKVPFSDVPATAKVNMNWSDAKAEFDESYDVKCIKLFKKEGQALLARDTKQNRKALAESIKNKDVAAAEKRHNCIVAVEPGTAQAFKPRTPTPKKRLPQGDVPELPQLQEAIVA